MSRTTIGLVGVALIYVLAWLVPVMEDGTTLTRGGVPGWEALRLALLPVIPYGGITGDRSPLSLVGVISALTNVLFIASFTLLALHPRKPHRRLFWGLVAGLDNTFWFLISDERGSLLVGYYLWLGSFVALAAAARSTFAHHARTRAVATAV